MNTTSSPRDDQPNRWILTDLDHDIDLHSVSIGPLWLEGADAAVVVRKRRLRGGLRDEVDVVEIDWGKWAVTVLPTRGMGIWRARWGEISLGWQSPVRGPVHPRWVPLSEPSGLGWLDGFDELVARCGLASNGAPDFDAQGRLQHALHGRIANQPAHYVAVDIDAQGGAVTLTGMVDESRFHFQKLRLISQLRLTAGQPVLSIIDRVENLSGTPSAFQLLYHNNIGTPFLGAGSRVHAAVQELVPRNDHAAADLARWDSLGDPVPGGTERVYLMKLESDADHRTRVVLTDPQQARGIGLKYRTDQLPCFTLWKNEVATADGYVTGLEPGTNFPNPHSFERDRGRTKDLLPDASHEMELQLEVYEHPEALEQALEAVAQLRQDRQPLVHDRPLDAWCAP